MRRSGDGFITVADGTPRWGRFGAAGVLLRHSDGNDVAYLLALRSLHCHRGGTWAIPGGAIDEGETPARSRAPRVRRRDRSASDELRSGRTTRRRPRRLELLDGGARCRTTASIRRRCTAGRPTTCAGSAATRRLGARLVPRVPRDAAPTRPRRLVGLAQPHLAEVLGGVGVRKRLRPAPGMPSRSQIGSQPSVACHSSSRLGSALRADVVVVGLVRRDAARPCP